MSNNKQSNGSPVEPFIGKKDMMGCGDLADEFLAIAHNVESALMNAGAVPGKDYTRLDLFQLAQPIVVAMVQSGRIDEHSYPSDKVLK